MNHFSDTTPVCYGELGCLSLNQSWYNSVHRPINLMPMARDRINVHFRLFTREKPTQVRNNLFFLIEKSSNNYNCTWTFFHTQGLLISAKNTTEITAATFKTSRPTKFYSHGYLATAYEDRIKVRIDSSIFCSVQSD